MTNQLRQDFVRFLLHVAETETAQAWAEDAERSRVMAESLKNMSSSQRHNFIAQLASQPRTAASLEWERLMATHHSDPAVESVRQDVVRMAHSGEFNAQKIRSWAIELQALDSSDSTGF
ncbi:hypothetical protein AYO47_09985 [Planctomyces sp. SCGC AG-212-M04]|nr:hypothetical protein AYO47_09985 [Planctomyces sp. SCGC AG-212-M04]